MTEKQLREFAIDKFMIVDMTDPKHPVNLEQVEGFVNACKARDMWKRHLGLGSKVDFYKI